MPMGRRDAEGFCWVIWYHETHETTRKVFVV